MIRQRLTKSHSHLLHVACSVKLRKKYVLMWRHRFATNFINRTISDIKEILFAGVCVYAYSYHQHKEFALSACLGKK